MPTCIAVPPTSTDGNNNFNEEVTEATSAGSDKTGDANLGVPGMCARRLDFFLCLLVETIR